MGWFSRYNQGSSCAVDVPITLYIPHVYLYEQD